MIKNLLSGLFAVCFAVLSAQKEGSSIDGTWLLDIAHNDIGQVNTVMYFKTEGNTFEAFTRKNADRDLLGWGTSMLGRMFTGGFKKGSLFRIANGAHKVENDTLKLSGVLVSALGNFYYKGFVQDGRMYARLTNRRGEERGEIKGKKGDVKMPLEDYPGLFRSAVALTREKIFNREVLRTKQWRKFEKKMGGLSTRVQDDLEMVFGFFYRAGKLPFSHFALMKIPAQSNNNGASGRERFVTIEEKSPACAYLKIVSFGGSAAEMDSALHVIITKGYKDLIVDLRDNSGGSVEAGMAFATSVFDTSFYGGVFLTQKWFNLHNSPPSVESYTTFPHFSDANFDLIIKGIHNTEGLCLKIGPKREVFKGRLFVLINKRTASTCEPLVYGLKQTKRATLIGERTAGAMLNGEILPLGKGFQLVVPTADYYASDGYHIDQQGVKPDISIPSAEALDHAIKILKVNEAGR